MDPVLRALLLSWDLRAEVILVLVLAGTVFGLGWWRIRSAQEQRLGRRRLATGWRLAAYLGGLVTLGVALMSPIDVPTRVGSPPGWPVRLITPPMACTTMS